VAQYISKLYTHNTGWKKTMQCYRAIK